MNITVNGEATLIEALSVQDFLLGLGIDPRRVAIEMNREILPKGAYSSTPLKEGDCLEIVNFVGGGSAPFPLSVADFQIDEQEDTRCLTIMTSSSSPDANSTPA